MIHVPRPYIGSHAGKLMTGKPWNVMSPSAFGIEWCDFPKLSCRVRTLKPCDICKRLKEGCRDDPGHMSNNTKGIMALKCRNKDLRILYPYHWMYTNFTVVMSSTVSVTRYRPYMTLASSRLSLSSERSPEPCPVQVTGPFAVSYSANIHLVSSSSLRTLPSAHMTSEVISIRPPILETSGAATEDCWGRARFWGSWLLVNPLSCMPGVLVSKTFDFFPVFSSNYK